MAVHSGSTPPATSAETSLLGTVGWIGVVLLGALLAIGVLSWLGPVGGQ